ncbi:MAG: NADH-quinone oxidoreductase subunit A [Armatimonadetes bacterium]|nr:NADH-quinone oxidoreductase subunit A [Armatimonadota bacterium]
MPEIADYGYVAIFFVGGLAFVCFNFALASLLTRMITAYRPHASKLITYECGEPPVGEAWVQYNVRYYIYAMLFVLFDVEAAFLIPWAVGFEQLYMMPAVGILALVEMLAFLAVLAVALIYAWRKGALEWV